MPIPPPTTSISADVRQAIRRTSPFWSWLPRAGYVASGILYLTIGLLAARGAVGSGGRATDSKGALVEVSRQPFGSFLLVLLIIGLAGFSLWRFLQALLDVESDAVGRFGVAKRLTWFVSGLVHVALLLSAVELWSEGRVASGSPKRSTAEVLAWGSFGPWLVGSVGVCLLGFGAYKCHSAIRAKLDEQLDLSQLPAALRSVFVTISRVGLAAFGIVAGIAGAFLVLAAVNSDASQAKGFGDSLRALRQAPFGQALFLAVAVGLMAYAGYEFIRAKFRRIVHKR